MSSSKGGGSKEAYANSQSNTQSNAMNEEAQKNSNDLLAMLAAYDRANPESARENEKFWRSVASNPKTKEAVGCTNTVLYGKSMGGNDKAAKAVAVTSMLNFGMRGKCSRDPSYGMNCEEGAFGSKCECGLYRTEMVEKK